MRRELVMRLALLGQGKAEWVFLGRCPLAKVMFQEWAQGLLQSAWHLEQKPIGDVNGILISEINIYPLLDYLIFPLK